MAHYLKLHSARYFREAVGFAFFLTWVYVTLFGCGLSTSSFVHRGLEYLWESAGLFECLIGLLGLAFVRRLAFVKTNVFAVSGTVFAIAGCFGIWLAYFNHDVFWTMRTLSGIANGAAIVCFSVAWGRKLRSYNESDIEFAIPASFALSFFFYCIILLGKTSSIPVLVLDCAFPFASALMLMRGRESSVANAATHNQGNTLSGTWTPVSPCDSSQVESPSLSSDLRRFFSLFVLVAFLWFQIAYFRILSTPDELGNRYWHFLIPFFCACCIAIGLFLMCLKASRYLNFTLMFRWALPLMLLSYALLFIDYQDPFQRIVAYAVNFVGMFGVQFSCWIAAPKYLRRSGESSTLFFLGLTAAQGIGVFAGCRIGMQLTESLTQSEFMTASMLFMVVVLFTAMIVGFNPRWLFNRDARRRDTVTPETGYGSPTGVVEENTSSRLESLFDNQAKQLQETFGLTERETEVASLLLSGRSRPYIRDELMISLNTVHAHARNIFSKCEIHSQQELMDLVRNS